MKGNATKKERLHKGIAPENTGLGPRGFGLTGIETAFSADPLSVLVNSRWGSWLPRA